VVRFRNQAANDVEHAEEEDGRDGRHLEGIRCPEEESTDDEERCSDRQREDEQTIPSSPAQGNSIDPDVVLVHLLEPAPPR
jgi:hypothetical protein